MTSNVPAPVGGADLEKLTRDLNQIDRTKEDHLYQLGLKLIPIRQMLQQMNGRYSGKTGADGLSPRGWGAWCGSAGISRTTASEAVLRAVDPGGHKSKRALVYQDLHSRPAPVIRRLKRAWPNWTEAQQQSVIDALVEMIHAS